MSLLAEAAAALIGFAAGATIVAGLIDKGYDHDWSTVRVYQGSTLVANPAALTPEELANAVIIAPTYRYVYCVDTGDVAKEEDQFPYPCKDIRHAE